MAPASYTPGASAYKTASKSVVTETEPDLPTPSTQNDDDYVYINVPQERMVPVNYGLTETVQHVVSHSAGPQNAATWVSLRFVAAAGTRVADVMW